MAENVAAATPEQLRELVLMLVERTETRDRELGPVKWTGPARPFFAVVGAAPPDGSRGARPTFVIEGVSELGMELLVA